MAPLPGQVSATSSLSSSSSSSSSTTSSSPSSSNSSSTGSNNQKIVEGTNGKGSPKGGSGSPRMPRPVFDARSGEKPINLSKYLSDNLISPQPPGQQSDRFGQDANWIPSRNSKFSKNSTADSNRDSQGNTVSTIRAPDVGPVSPDATPSRPGTPRATATGNNTAVTGAFQKVGSLFSLFKGSFKAISGGFDGRLAKLPSVIPGEVLKSPSGKSPSALGKSGSKIATCGGLGNTSLSMSASKKMSSASQNLAEGMSGDMVEELKKLASNVTSTDVGGDHNRYEKSSAVLSWQAFKDQKLNRPSGYDNPNAAFEPNTPKMNSSFIVPSSNGIAFKPTFSGPSEEKSAKPLIFAGRSPGPNSMHAVYPGDTADLRAKNSSSRTEDFDLICITESHELCILGEDAYQGIMDQELYSELFIIEEGIEEDAEDKKRKQPSSQKGSSVVSQQGSRIFGSNFGSDINRSSSQESMSLLSIGKQKVTGQESMGKQKTIGKAKSMDKLVSVTKQKSMGKTKSTKRESNELLSDVVVRRESISLKKEQKRKKSFLATCLPCCVDSSVPKKDNKISSDDSSEDDSEERNNMKTRQSVVSTKSKASSRGFIDIGLPRSRPASEFGSGDGKFESGLEKNHSNISLPVASHSIL